MRKSVNTFVNKEDDRLSRRGETIYYLGTLFFVAGSILLAFASASIMFFQIHYESSAKLIADTVTYMGIGLVFVSFGINLMLRQSKKGYVIFSTGTVFSLIAITLFYINYETNWFYPTISYILLSYLFGFLLLMGNAFGHVTLWILRKNQETVPAPAFQTKKEYTDEEIQKDIDEAIKQSLEQAAERLQFDLSDSPTFKVSHSSNSETVIRCKDDMNETMVLQQTLNPGDVEKWGGTGVDKASSLLAETLQEDISKKKSFLKSIHTFFSKR